MRVDIVVARSDEPLGWLPFVADGLRAQHVDAAVYVYDKGLPGSTKRVPGAVHAALPNVGREAHTYLHHMATSAECARTSNVTVYKAQPHTPGVTRAQFVAALVIQAMRHGLSTNVRNSDRRFGPTALVQLDAHYNFKLGSRSHLVDRRVETTLGAWWDTRLAGPLQQRFPPEPQHVSFYQGACFAVHSSLTRSLPRAVIEQGLQELRVSNAPEVGHLWERAWFFLFWAVRQLRGGDFLPS